MKHEQISSTYLLGRYLSTYVPTLGTYLHVASDASFSLRYLPRAVRLVP